MHGARVNNLKDVSVEIPKRRLTVFTGVSGSGKSSLVFGTIAAESQRLINETYSAFVQGFMPTLARPEVASARGSASISTPSAVSHRFAYPLPLVAVRAHPGNSRTTSEGSLSSRSPRNRGWRRRPSVVHSAKPICATS